ncbi:MAG TPA: hypothetical protein DCF68_09360 [Cyanothece sp. UBA12306]|nr:hypothetical protein [Cyanothece sp. UBA12306]
MNDKAQRLSALVKELRGSLSKGEFARKLGVDRSTISVWESARVYPESENLGKLARLKAWTLEELEAYLLEGELPTEDPLEQILRKIKTLPSESLAKVSAVAATTLAERIDSTEKLSVKI